MIYIDGVAYVDKTQTYKQTNNQSNNGVSFDSVFEAETTIYATPESGSNTPLPANNAPVTIPSVPANGAYSTNAGASCPASLEAYFQNAANTYGVDVNLLKSIAKAESNFNPSATSKVGASGVMQLMPQTAASLGVADPYNAEQNIMGGAKYISQLLNKYNGHISLALAAYNAGPGNVNKYNGIPPFKETQHYVNKVLNYYNNTNGTDYTGGNTATATSADVIYAVAVNDASSAGNIYSIPAVPSSLL